MSYAAVLCIIGFIGFGLVLSSLYWSMENRATYAWASLLVGAFLLFGAIASIRPPPHPFPAIPVAKYQAFLNSGYRFYVESNKVYAVKNEVVCLGPHDVNVEK